MELSTGSDDETVLLPYFAGDLDVEDDAYNIPNNQAVLDHKNVSLVPDEIVNHNRNANRGERHDAADNLPQRKHGRYNLRTNPTPSTKLKDSLVFILAILLLVPIVCGKDVHEFPEVGAIAERCKDVAVQ